jgi:hypothetical protein
MPHISRMNDGGSNIYAANKNEAAEPAEQSWHWARKLKS